LAALSVCVSALALEVALRVHHGKLLRFESLHQFESLTPERIERTAYHPRLGWIPKPGRFASTWSSNVDTSGVRSNGKSVSSTGRPILAVGDSFTFGNETEDSETWAADLQDVLNKRVINAGVGGYGIDQAVPRPSFFSMNTARML
jgi:hypothetical protein